MAKGILYVETHVDPAQVEAYHKWYNEEHLPEVCNLEGIVSARRFEPIEADGSFVATYEIDATSVEEARDALFAFMKSGDMSTPTGIDASKPFVMKFFREIGSHQP
jgi:hypothetical protein